MPFHNELLSIKSTVQEFIFNVQVDANFFDLPEVQALLDAISKHVMAAYLENVYIVGPGSYQKRVGHLASILQAIIDFSSRQSIMGFIRNQPPVRQFLIDICNHIKRAYMALADENQDC